MPKAIARRKTKKAVAKRFKITGTGKVLRSQAGKRHLLVSKSGKRKRQLAKTAVLDKTDEARIKENLPIAQKTSCHPPAPKIARLSSSNSSGLTGRVRSGSRK